MHRRHSRDEIHSSAGMCLWRPPDQRRLGPVRANVCNEYVDVHFGV